jgi:hypothetical protein
MAKVHTRAKRKTGAGTHRRKPVSFSRKRKKRPKTFSSEELARVWAEKNKIKNYELVDLRGGGSKKKKIKIVVK